VLLPDAGGPPMAVDPDEGAPVAVLPGVVGPDMLLLPVVPADELCELPYAPCPVLPMATLPPGAVLLLPTVGSQGWAPGAVLDVEPEVAPVLGLDVVPELVPELCAKANPLAASAAATRLVVNALISTPSKVDARAKGDCRLERMANVAIDVPSAPQP